MTREVIGGGVPSQASPADKWISRAAAGTVAALAGLAGAISYSQAGWPARALLLAVKLLSGMLNHPAGPEPVPAKPASGRTSPGTALTVSPAHASASRHDGGKRWRESAQPKPLAGSAARRPPGRPPPAALPSTDLLAAARAARDEPHNDGHNLTRDALAARLRANGHPVRNSASRTRLEINPTHAGR